MNIVNKLTLRQLKLNKKRTLVTIIGTIISAAMITAVATLGLSFMDIMQRDTIAETGEWHVRFHDVNQEQLEAIKTDSRIKTVMLSSEPGYTYLEGSNNQNKPYLHIKNLDEKGLEKFPIKLMEGRLPEKPDEVVLNNEVRTDAKVDYKLGDVIELTVGQRYATAEDSGIAADEPMLQNYPLQWEEDTVAEALSVDSKKTYTIVGFMERPSWEYNWSPGYSAVSFIDSASMAEGATYDVSVIFSKINNKLFGTAERIATDNGITSYEFNNQLLRYYGVVKDDTLKQMLYILSAIILGIIVIGSVSLIYNAFAISVSERSRYLGMLSSVGATKRQKRNSVFFEGAVIGAVSIPLGILAGYAGLGITYIFINPLLKQVFNVEVGFRLVVAPSALIVTILVSAATILISTYIPARRASNISAIDAIRQATDVRIRGRQVRTFRFTRRLFGIEGDLGLKNLKRNKGRYKATVFSLVISMVLFLVVSSFTDYMKKSLELTQDGINFDIWTIVSGDSEAEKAALVERISSLDHIKELNVMQVLSATALIEEEKAADFLKIDGIKEDGKYLYDNISVIVMEDAAVKKYADKIGADFDELMDTAQPSAIVIDTMKFKDIATDKYVETKLVKTKTGDLLGLDVIDQDTAETVELGQVKVAALTGELPMGVVSQGKIAGFPMIMTRTVFDAFIEGKEDLAYSRLTPPEVYFDSDAPLQLQTELEKVQAEVGASSLYVYNVYNYRDAEEQALLLVSVFTYAFIILITAICIANIINTISTSIALRKREFAMLKSIGITPKGFNRMLNYESIFYGIKALIYGLPISILIIYLMYRTLMIKLSFGFVLPWTSIYIVVAAVFLIVGTAMLYSGSRVRKENIIDALKQEII